MTCQGRGGVEEIKGGEGVGMEVLHKQQFSYLSWLLGELCQAQTR